MSKAGPPLIAGKIHGLRSWKVLREGSSGTPWLSSAAQDTLWPKDRPFDAECLDEEMAPHFVTDPECGCGVYGLHPTVENIEHLSDREGWYEIENDVTGQGLRVDWDVASLPHLWIWREARASGGLWRGQAELLGLEPASVPHSLGLARALDEAQAIELARGATHRSAIQARPFHRS